MDEKAEYSKQNYESDVPNNFTRSRKRKLDDSTNEPDDLIETSRPLENGDICPNKIQKSDDIVSAEQNDQSTSKCSSELGSADINSLSDEVLLILLSYLDSSDLFHLSQCSSRFFNICGDKSLWVKVNSTCNGCHPFHHQVAKFFHSGTKHMRFVKKEGYDHRHADMCFTEDFFQNLREKTPKLQSLVIENHMFNTPMFELHYLPETITELRFPRVKIRQFHQNKYFISISSRLPNLEIIDVSYCQWFNAHALFMLAKCDNLKQMIIAGCRNLKDFIPYASIAANFGFKKLETLDLRMTAIADREVACFNKTESLKHIYLEKPDDVEYQPQEDSITDVCISSFGMRCCEPELPHNMVFIQRIPRNGGSFKDYKLETLVVRNYPGITDITLKHAEKCLKSLKYLDVTGCSCTLDQATIFKQNRPEVKLIYDNVAM